MCSVILDLSTVQVKMITPLIKIKLNLSKEATKYKSTTQSRIAFQRTKSVNFTEDVLLWLRVERRTKIPRPNLLTSLTIFRAVNFLTHT